MHLEYNQNMVMIFIVPSFLAINRFKFKDTQVMHSRWRACLLMFDCEVHQPHRRCPVRVSHSTWLFPVCLKCRLYRQHKHVLARKLQSCWKQWCQSHHGNCSYKWCLFFHSPLLPLSMWHPSVISFCHNALGINVPMPRTQKGKTLTFCSAPNARREQGQEVCLWALSGVGGLCWWHCGIGSVNVLFVTHSCIPFKCHSLRFGTVVV